MINWRKNKQVTITDVSDCLLQLLFNAMQEFDFSSSAPNCIIKNNINRKQTFSVSLFFPICFFLLYYAALFDSIELYDMCEVWSYMLQKQSVYFN